MSEMLKIRDECKMQMWTEIIRDCQGSGMTVKAYCDQRGVSEKSYYYYLKKLRTMTVEANGVQLVQIPPPELEDKPELLHIKYKCRLRNVLVNCSYAQLVSVYI